jgi:hypothetical protein
MAAEREPGRARLPVFTSLRGYPGRGAAGKAIAGLTVWVLLVRLKDWVSAHNAVIMAVPCLIIAAKFIGDGISALTG